MCTAIKESGFEITEVLSGSARGPDQYGERWANERRIPVKYFPAKWNDLSAPNCIVKTNDYGKQYNANAGFARNIEMADEAEALIAVIKGNSAGTRHMIREAERRSLKVFIYNVDKQSQKDIDKVPF